MRGVAKCLAFMCLLQHGAHSHLDGVKEFCSDVKRMNSQCEDLNASTKTDCSNVTPGTFKFQNGNRPVYQLNIAGERIDASCDLTTDGGGWTVIQRRTDGSVDFFRTHSDYVKGFGKVDGEFWIGLRNLYRILQTSKKFQLRIEMEDWNGVKKFAKYSQFSIGSPTDDYTLTVSGFSGSAGDSLSYQNGQKFSTRDRDLDTDGINCAESYKGGWWYAKCHESNLNGLYHRGGPHNSYADGINWKSWKGYHYSLKFVEMKIKPVV